ncbi:MAG: TolC family protein [Planctomycetaceae bacterium]|nr:TolC family protein [Planctomycetaceae bacterium]
MKWIIVGGMLLASLVGCATTAETHCRQDVSCRLAERTGFTIGETSCLDGIQWPNGASLEDGLTEEEAVVLALWNNGAFQEVLVECGLAQADLVQAGLLPNPEAIYFFPMDDKPFKYAFEFPLEALWLRPIRVAAAEREVARVTERLTQSGLDLIRDVRQAYADLLLAERRATVAEEARSLRERIAEVSDKRLEAGDISRQEAVTAAIDAQRARQEEVRTRHDVTLAEERLRLVMGLGDVRSPLKLQTVASPTRSELDVDTLTAEATSYRPDAQAAARATETAAERLELAEVGWFRFLGILDATSGRASGHEFGPAFRLTLPLFHQNQGAIARAQAELEQAARRRQTVHQQIVWDVRTAHERLAQAQAELAVLQQDVQPRVEDAIARAEAAYLAGNTPYVVVLEISRQLIDARLREAQLRTDSQRAWVELERSVGRHLVGTDASNLVPPAPINDSGDSE